MKKSMRDLWAEVEDDSLQKRLFTAEELRAKAPKNSHPHIYPWGGNEQQLAKANPTAHPHTDGAVPPGENWGQPRNEQAAGVGVPTYARFAGPYGEIKPGVKSNLFHYDYRPVASALDDLVRQSGYDVYIAGGKYGRDDLKNRNYNTGHLMIYDPTPRSGGDFGDEEYTRTWRTAHELAHALTYKDLNAKYGEGRRLGKLGVRTPREAKRAVEWEWMAAHKQRELSEKLGLRIPDDVFARELNTVMHDAVHRAVTGQFTEPSDEGFHPHSRIVPLETALSMIDEEAKKLGLRHDDDTLRALRQAGLGKSMAELWAEVEDEPLRKALLISRSGKQVAFEPHRKLGKSEVSALWADLSDDLLQKSKPTPRFPKLGLPDDRRETPIVKPGSLAHKNKVALIRSNALSTPVAQAAIKEHATAAGVPPEVVKRGAINLEVEKESKAKTRTALGLTPAFPTSSPAFALGATSKKTPNSPKETQLHEDGHLMFRRLDKKFGAEASYAVARHLIESMPERARKTVTHFASMHAPKGARWDGMVHGPEENITYLLSYLNGQPRRAAIQAAIPDRMVQLLYDKAMKEGYRHVIDEAKTIDEAKLRDLIAKYPVPDIYREVGLVKKELDGQKNMRYKQNMDKKLNYKELFADVAIVDRLASKLVKRQDDADPLHPILETEGERVHGIFTPDDPHADPDQDVAGLDAPTIAQSLAPYAGRIDLGRGVYSEIPENSIILSDIDPETVLWAGYKTGQEAVVLRIGNKNYGVFVNGDSAGTAVTGEGYQIWDEPPTDGTPYTEIPTPVGSVYLLLNIDWGGDRIEWPLPKGMTPKPPRKKTYGA